MDSTEKSFSPTIHGDLSTLGLDDEFSISGCASSDVNLVKHKRWKLKELLAHLTNHSPGPKNGSCILQGSVSGRLRGNKHMKGLDLMIHDIDSGEPYDDVVQRLQLKGYLCVVYTTHSHGKTVSDVGYDALLAWAKSKGLQVNSGTAAKYMVEVVGYHASVVAQCELLSATPGANNCLQLRHLPMSKYRIVHFLHDVFELPTSEFARKDAVKAWKAAYHDVGAMLEVSYDKACADVARLFYLPRYASGAEFRADIIVGEYLDLASVPKIKAAALTNHKPAKSSTLRAWAVKNAKRFDAANFLADHWDRFRNHGSTVKGRCPHEIKHSKPFDDEDYGFYAINASDADNGTFVMGCFHDHCDHLDRLDLLEMVLEELGMTPADLEPYLSEIENWADGADTDSEAPAASQVKSASMPSKNADLSDWLRYLSENYAVVYVNKKAMVADLSNGSAIRFYKQEDFRMLFANKSVKGEGGKGRDIQVADAWLRYEGRPTYFDCVFEPGRVTDTALNLWAGFAVKPSPGVWSLMRSHIENMVCHGDEEYFDCFMTWMADIIQHPGRKMGSAVVLLGGKGTGKSIVFDALGHCIGRSHAIKIDKANSLVGQFNSHFEYAVFAQVEEAVWGGDKQSEGVLKNLITSNALMIEGKGRDPYYAKNYTRVGITSNENWVVPATADERRFLVLEVDGARQGDLGYFSAIAQQLANGGYEAMLYDLLHYTPKSSLGWDVLRNPPQTVWLTRQMDQSKSVHARFVDELIGRGFVDFDKYAEEQPQLVKGGTVTTFRPMELQCHFARFCEQTGASNYARGNGNPAALMTELGKRLSLTHVPDTTRDGVRSVYYDVDDVWPPKG